MVEPQVQPPERLKIQGREGLHLWKHSFSTVGTEGDVLAGAFEDPFPRRFLFGFFEQRRLSQCQQSDRKQPSFHAVVEDTVITDAVE